MTYRATRGAGLLSQRLSAEPAPRLATLLATFSEIICFSNILALFSHMCVLISDQFLVPDYYFVLLHCPCFLFWGVLNHSSSTSDFVNYLIAQNVSFLRYINRSKLKKGFINFRVPLCYRRLRFDLYLRLYRDYFDCIVSVSYCI